MTKTTNPGLLARWRAHRARQATIQRLQQLGPHLLRDIGIEPDDVSAAAIARRSQDYFRR